MRRRFLMAGLAGLMYILCSVAGTNLQAQVRINEFLAVNNTILADGDGDYSDWIELYNEGSTSVLLGGWALSDHPGHVEKWVFPNMALNPGEYLLVFASGKNRNDPAGELHAGFKLSGGGEYLALLDASGTAVSEFSPGFPPQKADISYGFLDGLYVSFINPTPGGENDPESLVLPPPVLSHPHGIYEDPFQLELSTDFPGAEIYYTLDGSVPSLEEALSYTGSLDVHSTTILRAVLVLENSKMGEMLTATYLFPATALSQDNSPPGYPANWGPYTAIDGTSIADYEMDPEMLADDNYRTQVLEAMRSLPHVSLVTERDFLFSLEENEESGGIYIHTGAPLSRTTYGPGRGWERPASMEFLDDEGSRYLQVDCGIRLHGGHSRRPEKCPKHSFRVVFKDEYGPTRLEFPIFSDEDAVTNFNSLVLRAGFGLSWVHWNHEERRQAQYIQDIWAKDSQRELGHPSSHSEFVHLYLNGLYWGIYALSERLDKDYADAYMEGGEDDFDVIKDYQDVVDGSIDSWNRLMDAANAGVADNEDFQKIQGRNPDGSGNPEYESLVDVPSLIDYMLINFYGGNTDWDHHNWVAMNNRVDWRRGYSFFCWDSEHLLKYLDTNVLDENNEDCPSRVFQQLKANPAFRMQVADRAHQLCFNEGGLSPEATAARWEERSQVMEPAIRAEATRWGDYRRDVHPYQSNGPFDLYDYEHYWLDQRSFLTDTYFPQRTAVLISQLRSAGLYPALDAPEFFINEESYPVDEVRKGDRLSMSSAEGVIYYTRDGSDPADFGGGDASTQILVAKEADKYVLIPDSDVGEDWYKPGFFDHGSWSLCSGSPGGVGYEEDNGYEGLISLDTGPEMSGTGLTSSMVRIPFEIAQGSDLSNKKLLLSVQYDDGFAAFLNGVRVAEDNAPLSLSWNSAASGSHEHEGDEVFDISEWLDLLEEGENLLAIQAMNIQSSSSDFLVNASLHLSDEASVSVSEAASLYTEELTLDHSSLVVARTWLDGEWSAAMRAGFFFEEDLEDIRLTEIHYEPLGTALEDGADFEFVELKNVGTATLDLGGVSFTEGIEYTFAPGTSLAPGAFKVLASSEMSFAERYGFYPEGEYGGNLNNGGEILRLDSPAEDTLFRILYDDVEPWPDLSRYPGHSVVPLEFNPPPEQGNGKDWRASFLAGGSPGMDDLDITGAGYEPLASDPFSLGQNYPNPFKDMTWFSFSLDREAEVEIQVYNLLGQQVAVPVSGKYLPGEHVIPWDGAVDGTGGLHKGVYLYRLVCKDQSGIRSISKKMIKF